MKDKTTMIIGFVVGLTGFLFLFKVIFLDTIPPEDELAPGIVVMAAILNGLLVAFAGRSIQNYFRRERN